MAGLFYNLGKMLGQGQRKAEWVLQSLTGSEAESIEAEYAVGRDLANTFGKENELDPDPDVQRFLDEVAARLKQCVTESKRRFAFRAVVCRQYNAFAYPGGFIFVTVPLLELCAWNADEVAFVLAHEMGHVIARHAVNRMTADSVFRGTLSRLPIGGLVGMGVFRLANTLLSQGYSREQELEADHLGIRLVHFAGFDVAAAKRLLVRLSGVPAEGWQGSTYFSSHPAVNVRVEKIEEYMRGLMR